MTPRTSPNPGPRAQLTRRQLLARSTHLAVAATAAGGLSACADASFSEPTTDLSSPTPRITPSLMEQLANPEAAIANGDAWIAFCDALKPLAQHVTGPESLGDPQIQAEGIRCLSRLVSLGLDRFLEHGDPRHPAFYDLQTPTRKYLGDNPDQTYRGAALEASGTYRIRGNAADAAGVEIGVYSGSFRSDEASLGGGRRLVDSLDEHALAIEDDGSFEILVRRADPESETRGDDSTPAQTSTVRDDVKPGRNELRLEADANAILIRTYFWDRELRSTQAMPTIERLDVTGPAPPVDATTILRSFLATTMFVDGSLAWWNRFEGIKTGANELIVMPDDGSVQTPSLVRYLNGRVELAANQAFVVEFDPVDAPEYWSWVLQNVWGETPDWRDRPIVLNNRDVVPEPDGRIRIVVAHEDPGVSNWMDMSGHPRLLMSLRWRGANALPKVTTRTTTLDVLRSA